MNMDRRMPNREQLERWLASEAAGQDDAAAAAADSLADDAADAAADAAFAHLFAAMPRIEPRAEFIGRTVTEVGRMRARHRRILALGWVATIATIVLVVAGAVTAYVASPRVATSIIKALAFAGGHGVPWLVAYTTVAMDWWWTLARVGGAVASELVTPARIVAIVGIELVGILAFFALQRIAGVERLGDAHV
jgi:ActR/RegA family two-component response regulator